MKEKKTPPIPNVAELESELKREKYKNRYWKVFRSTIYILITVAAVAVLVATLWLPVLQIYGSSMSPTLEEGDIVVSIKSKNYETGDIVAFYYNNKILIKRVIASSGDWVDLDEDGTVYVNGEKLDEPYVKDKAFGECDLELPYQVPESRIFVMGDHRSVSVDSRSKAVGCVAEEQIVGKLVCRIWPLTDIQTLY
ncbi:MAG: signal peptidase I [Dorea sp.]|nr:signal peptidase I [Dorea sp.]